MCCAIHTQNNNKKDTITQQEDTKSRALLSLLTFKPKPRPKNCKVKKTNERYKEKCVFWRYGSTAVRGTSQNKITLSRTARKS